jgi:3-dehydroquinate dehydratase-2
MKILIINGPNLNLLGLREPEVYGTLTYKEMCIYIKAQADALGVDVELVQSNIEGEIINFIHGAQDVYDGIVINPGAYTHYSIAIHDALKSVSVPAVEVHLTNIHSREEFRRKSVTAAACRGQISGMGAYGYVLSMMGLINMLKG